MTEIFKKKKTKKVNISITIEKENDTFLKSLMESTGLNKSMVIDEIITKFKKDGLTNGKSE